MADIKIEDYVPAVKYSDSLFTEKPVVFDSASASALTVGANGSTNPVLKVDASTASVATGVSVTGAAAGSGVTIAAISTSPVEPLILASKGGGPVVINGTVLGTQGSPTAKTVSSTLTGDQLFSGIITVNQGAGATSAQQLPTATDMDALSTLLATNNAIRFSVINTSTVDAEDASITTNTGWTLVGSMDIPAYSAAGSLNSSASFLARKTGTAAWTLYRMS